MDTNKSPQYNGDRSINIVSLVAAYAQHKRKDLYQKKILIESFVYDTKLIRNLRKISPFGIGRFKISSFQIQDIPVSG